MTAAQQLRRRGRAAAVGTGLAGVVGALTPVWWVHDRVSRAATARRGGGTVDIERIAAPRGTLDQLVARRRPTIAEGLVDELGLTGVASREGVRDRLGDRTVTVATYDGSAPYFLYSGGYGSTERSRRTMTVTDLLDEMFDGGVDDDSVVYQLLGPRSLDGATRALLGEVEHALLERCSVPAETRFSGVWMGSTGAVTPLHHDAWPGLLFQTEGTKRVAMYAPIDRANLAFRNPLRGEGRWSDLPGRSADADPTEFPRLARATRFEAVLQPGDALVIPPYWAHEMEGLEPNISIPFRFRGRRRNWVNPGFLRPASELLRKQVTTVFDRPPR